MTSKTEDILDWGDDLLDWGDEDTEDVLEKVPFRTSLDYVSLNDLHQELDRAACDPILVKEARKWLESYSLNVRKQDSGNIFIHGRLLVGSMAAVRMGAKRLTVVFGGGQKVEAVVADSTQSGEWVELIIPLPEGYKHLCNQTHLKGFATDWFDTQKGVATRIRDLSLDGVNPDRPPILGGLVT